MEGLRGAVKRGQDAVGDSARQIPGVRPPRLQGPHLNPYCPPLSHPSKISPERMIVACRLWLRICMRTGTRTMHCHHSLLSHPFHCITVRSRLLKLMPWASLTSHSRCATRRHTNGTSGVCRNSRVVLFDTHTSNTLIQSTMAVVAIYKATAKKLEFASGKSRMATLFFEITMELHCNLKKS